MRTPYCEECRDEDTNACNGCDGRGNDIGVVDNVLKYLAEKFNIDWRDVLDGK